MKVLKFGGSSLRDATRLAEVKDIISEELSTEPIVVVVSAMGKTTDALLRMYHAPMGERLEICDEICQSHETCLRELCLPFELIGSLCEEMKELCIDHSYVPSPDEFVSFGERLSARILAGYLNAQGSTAISADAWELGMISSPHAGSEMVSQERYSEIAKNIVQATKAGTQILIVTGFILKDEEGGSEHSDAGGSDLTATILGACLRASEVQVWKDVDGVLTADPRVVPNAKPIEFLSYAEATELAYFGAKVLHPVCLQPVARLGIPIRVRNSYNRNASGTRISPFQEEQRSSSHSTLGAVAVTSKARMVLLTLHTTDMLGQYGFLGKVFQIFADLQISVDMITTSEVSVSLTLSPTQRLPELCERLKVFADLQVREDVGAVSVIGRAEYAPAILSRAGNWFAKESVPLEMVSVGASRLNIGFVLPARDVHECVAALHKNLFNTF